MSPMKQKESQPLYEEANLIYPYYYKIFHLQKQIQFHIH